MSRINEDSQHVESCRIFFGFGTENLYSDLELVLILKRAITVSTPPTFRFFMKWIFIFNEKFKNPTQSLLDTVIKKWVRWNQSTCTSLTHAALVFPCCRVVPVKHYRFSEIDACALSPEKGNSTDSDIGPVVLCVFSWLSTAFKCTAQCWRAQFPIVSTADWLCSSP